MLKLKPALEANRKKQIQREQLWQRCRDLQVGTQHDREDPQEEKQNRRRQQVLQDQAGVQGRVRCIGSTLERARRPVRARTQVGRRRLIQSGSLLTVDERQEPLEFVLGGGMFNPSLPHQFT